MATTKEKVVFEWIKPTEEWKWHASCGCIATLYQYDGDVPSSLALCIDRCFKDKEAEYLTGYDNYSAETEKEILADAASLIQTWMEWEHPGVATICNWEIINAVTGKVAASGTADNIYLANNTARRAADEHGDATGEHHYIEVSEATEPDHATA